MRSDLRGLGAAEVIELAELDKGIRDPVMSITEGKGLNALADNVGGPVTGDLIRSMAFGGQVIINGGMSPERFDLHNFDVLLRGIEIRSHVYRYFFTPPKADDLQELAEIATAAGSPEFKVPVGGLNHREQFRIAVQETLEHPARGKQFFVFESDKP